MHETEKLGLNYTQNNFLLFYCERNVEEIPISFLLIATEILKASFIMATIFHKKHVILFSPFIYSSREVSYTQWMIVVEQNILTRITNKKRK
jgi:hypothetical protein